MSNLTLNDLMKRYYDALVSGDSSLLGAINVSPAVVGISANTSSSISGTQNAPIANATIATMNVPVGVWRLTCYLGLCGTLADLDVDNMELALNGVDIVRIPVDKAGSITEFSYQFKAAGTQAVTIKANAASTAGSIYKATIVADQIGF